MKRSSGVTMFGWFFIVANILVLVSGLFSLIVGPQVVSQVSPQDQATMNQALESLRSPMGLLSFATVVAGVVAGVGLLGLKRWAPLLVIILAGIRVIHTLIGAMNIPQTTQVGLAGAAFVMALSVLAVNGLIIWFFLRASVKKQFQPSQ